MTDRTPVSTPSIPKASWASRIPLIICCVILAYWYLRPSSGGSFIRVPIAPVEAPAWTADAVDGTRLNSTNYRGQVLIINFWATFCPPCLREIPELAAFHTAHSGHSVSVVALSLDQTGIEHVRRFVENNHVPYPTAMANSVIAESFGGVAQIPSTFIVGRDGKFVAHYLGALTRDELERAIAPLTNQPTPARLAP